MSKPKLQWKPSSDVTSGMMKYQLFLNNNLNIDNIPPNEVSVSLSSDLSDGDFLWYILAYDSALNVTQSESKWHLQIDTTPPSSAINNLSSGMFVTKDTLVIEGTSNDGNGTNVGCGVDSVFISFDDGNSWLPTINMATNFSVWQYIWTGYESQNYMIKSKAIDKVGNEEIPKDGMIVTQINEKVDNNIPKEFALHQNYPNPFNPETVIGFQLPKPCFVTIKVYNTLGQEVKTLVNKNITTGYYQVIWDGKDNYGGNVGSGIFLYQIKAGNFIGMKKMIMLQ